MPYTVIMGSAVRCTDGKAGSVGGLVINPNRNHVDYVILNTGARGGREYFVPIGRIQRASAGELTLPCTWAELDDLPRPEAGSEQGTVQDNLEDLCLAREHTPVRDADGSMLGQLHGALVDTNFEIQSILLDQAPDEAIPITSVARYSDHTDGIVVYLAQQAEA